MTLGVLTTGRQDWGILRSTVRALETDQRWHPAVFVGGMHCSRMFGHTLDGLLEERIRPTEVLRWLPDAPPLPSGGIQASEALRQVAGALERHPVDALLLVGDRLETAAAALAATLARVPLVHLHGGEETEGAIDNVLRHAITKLSHLHLVSHATYRERVLALGEDPTTVHVVGAPGLDNLARSDLPDRAELERMLGVPLPPPVVLVTLHPVTLGDASAEAREVTAAMDAVEATYVITLPNSDPGADETRRALAKAAETKSRVAMEALGEQRYWGLMRVADAMLGNSSSALIEAPAVGLPAVNVGDRQKGRLRGASVLDVPADRGQIAEALRRALRPEFRRGLPTASPLGDGRSAERIRDILRGWTPPKPPRKRVVA